MYSFEYSIQLNEFNRPVLEPSQKTDKELDLIEHKFMAFELVRSLIGTTITSHELDPVKHPLSESDYERFKSIHSEIEAMSDLFALTIRDQMELLNDTKVMLSPRQYDLQVRTLDELHALNYSGIIYGDKLFSRKEGLRVMVMINKKIYELKGGIDNEHWFDTSL